MGIKSLLPTEKQYYEHVKSDHSLLTSENVALCYGAQFCHNSLANLHTDINPKILPYQVTILTNALNLCILYDVLYERYKNQNSLLVRPNKSIVCYKYWYNTAKRSLYRQVVSKDPVFCKGNEVCKVHELKQSEPKSSPQNQNGK